MMDSSGVPCGLLDRYLSGVKDHLNPGGKVFGLAVHVTFSEDDRVIDQPILQQIMKKNKIHPVVLNESLLPLLLLLSSSLLLLLLSSSSSSLTTIPFADCNVQLCGGAESPHGEKYKTLPPIGGMPHKMVVYHKVALVQFVYDVDG